ncbi:hypothetical protein ACMYSQ_011080 [Aspergillus niger]
MWKAHHVSRVDQGGRPQSWGKMDDLVNLGIGKGQKRGRAVPSNSSSSCGLVVLPGLCRASPLLSSSALVPSVTFSSISFHSLESLLGEECDHFFILCVAIPRFPLTLSCVAERHPSLPAQAHGN